MKSYVTNAITVYGGIFLDATHRWPELRDSFEKDLFRLRRDVENRGIAFLGITLPALGKALDRGLDQGRLDPTLIPKGIKKDDHGPLFLRGLWNKVFDAQLMLLPNACIESIFFLRQFLYCCKKMKLDASQESLEEVLAEFFDIEKRMLPPWPQTWDDEVPKWQPRLGHPITGIDQEDLDNAVFDYATRSTLSSGPRISERDWDTLRQLCRYVISNLGTPDWWSFECKHGPGVTSERQTRKVNDYAKDTYMSKYEFPNWPRKLGLWFPFDWYATGSLDPVDVQLSEYEPPSRLIAVPKTLKGPRLICAEPLSHQWVQQGLWKWLEQAVRTSRFLGKSINFRSQEYSREGALDASIDGRRATIDLSSASDRLSCRLVEYVFQGSEILDGLHACRTRYTVQNLSETQPAMAVLKKFSTMGSACTFPIQSMVYTLLTVWAIRLCRGQHHHLGELESTFSEVTVFGDDIIAPTECIGTINLVLSEVGMKVNSDKSFWTGLFRESCGVDAYKGHDVTPAYFLQPYDDSASSIATVVETSNNFFRKGLWNTAETIVSSIPIAERKLLRVCGSEDGNFGLLSFVGSDTSHLTSGWCPHLQRQYSISLVVAAKVTKVRGRGSADLTQYFTERPDPDLPWSGGQVSGIRPRKRRMRVYD